MRLLPKYILIKFGVLLKKKKSEEVHHKKIELIMILIALNKYTKINL